MCTGFEIATIGANVLGGLGSMAAADAQSDAYKQQAKAAKFEAEENARRAREEAERFKGKQRAKFAKSGVTFAGTPEEVLSETAADSELEALSIIHGGESQAVAYRNQANQAKAKGRIGLINGFTSAAGVGLGSTTGLRAKSAPVVDKSRWAK